MKQHSLLQQLEIIQKKVSVTTKANPIAGYMIKTKQAFNERSEHFKTVKAAVDGNKMTIE